MRKRHPSDVKTTHTHHLLPRHMGGTDEESNLVHGLSITRHAMFHFANWQLWGRQHDRIAWRGLAGLITPEQASLEAMRLGQSEGGKIGGSKGGKNQPREVKVANCHKMRKHLTPEMLSRGGKGMSAEQRRRNGLITAEKTRLPVILTSPSGEVITSPSIQEAAVIVGCKPSSLVNVLKGRRNKVWNWTAKYLK